MEFREIGSSREKVKCLNNDVVEIRELSRIVTEIHKNDDTLGIFDFSINKREFKIYFDIGVSPYILGFLLRRSDFQLWFDVHTGYNINTFLGDKYGELCDVLGLEYDKLNPFSPKIFFEEFKRQIPDHLPNISTEERRNVILKANPNIEEGNKPYYYGEKNWNLPHNKGKGNRSPENLEKTRKLYPKLYERTKNHNISILYTDNPIYEKTVD